MALSKWAMQEQLEFLTQEDSKWEITKAGAGTLKNFYARTSKAFLEKWPDYEDAETQGSLEDRLKMVSAAIQFLFTSSHFILQRIVNWYSNRHHQKKTSPTAPKPMLDLAGKSSCKKPPLQKWQAFSSIYYRPRNSPLCVEVKSLYDRRHDPSAIEFLSEFLPPDTNITTIDRLTFLGAFSRERCTHLSSKEKEEVQAYVERQQLLAAEHRDRPWFLDDNYEDKPLLAENRYIQQ